LILPATAKAEVFRVSLLPRPGLPQPPPGTIPAVDQRFAIVEYRFLDSGVQAAIQVDDWEMAPGIGQLIEVSMQIVPNVIAQRLPPPPPGVNFDFHDGRPGDSHSMKDWIGRQRVVIKEADSALLEQLRIDQANDTAALRK